MNFGKSTVLLAVTVATAGAALTATGLSALAATRSAPATHPVSVVRHEDARDHSAGHDDPARRAAPMTATVQVRGTAGQHSEHSDARGSGTPAGHDSGHDSNHDSNHDSGHESRS